MVLVSTLAYYETATITDIICFIVLAHDIYSQNSLKYFLTKFLKIIKHKFYRNFLDPISRIILCKKYFVNTNFLSEAIVQKLEKNTFTISL